MRTNLACLVTAGALALGSLTVACGDDDSGATDGTDGGASSSSSSGGPDGSTGDGGANPDGATGACTFATYVIGLVGSSTNATALPDTTLGASCAPSTSQDEFKSLFP
jgi:hypothetical protein